MFANHRIKELEDRITELEAEYQRHKTELHDAVAVARMWEDAFGDFVAMIPKTTPAGDAIDPVDWFEWALWELGYQSRDVVNGY